MVKMNCGAMGFEARRPRAAYSDGRYRRAPQNSLARPGRSIGTVSTVRPVAGAWIILPSPT